MLQKVAISKTVEIKLVRLQYVRALTKSMQLKMQKGQSLLETVIATGMVAMVLVSLINIMTVALANVQFSRNNGLAGKYAQETVEWLRSERDKSWANFYAQAAASPGVTYCLPTVGVWPAAGSCTNSVIDDQYDIFSREMTLTRDPLLADRILVVVRVSWLQGSRPENVTITTYLTQWK